MTHLENETVDNACGLDVANAVAFDQAAQNAIVQNVVTEKVLERIMECAEIDTVEVEDCVG